MVTLIERIRAEEFKVAALVAGNGLGTAAQFTVAPAQQVESYLRLGLLFGQVVLIVLSIIYAYRKLKKKN